MRFGVDSRTDRKYLLFHFSSAKFGGSMDVRRAHRPLIIGRNGAVASNHPIATQVGLDILRAGGHASDAAIAVALTLGVVEPHMSGLGGDGFYHTFDSSTGEGRVYNGSGHAPAGSRPKGLTSLPLDGPLSVSVPGMVAALGALHRDTGTLPWKDLVSSAIPAARDGFGVTHVYQRFAKKNLTRVLGSATTSKIFLRLCQVPDLGQVIAQDALSKSLEILADEGAESFYRGSLAKGMVREMASAGVPINASDLAPYFAEVQMPISVDYRGFEVRQTPPNSTGFVLLEVLKIFEQFDIRDRQRSLAEITHLLIEAKKLAFVDRERAGGDPRFITIPITKLLSSDYAQRRSAEIDPECAVTRPVRPVAGEGNTTFFCVIDRQGNAVSAIQSLNGTFGSGILLPESGILLNNRMSCWHLEANHPNGLEEGKRVRHTMNAPMVIKNGKVWAIFGTPGADDQVQINLQVAVALMDYDRDPQSAVEAPRWSSSQPGQGTDWPHMGPDILTVERDFDANAIKELVARGHAIHMIEPLDGAGSVACIRILDNGTYVAASDPRRDGWAGAF